MLLRNMIHFVSMIIVFQTPILVVKNKNQVSMMILVCWLSSYDSRFMRGIY